MTLPAPATAKGAHTRDMLLGCACQLAARVGLEGVSIGDLASAAGMSKSGVFAHFGSREDLVRETLEWAAAGFNEAVLVPALRKPRGMPRLEAIIAGWLEWILDHPEGCVFLGAISEYDGRPGPMRDFVTRMMERWREVVETAVRKALEEGHLRAGTDPAQLAFELHGVMYGLHHVRLHVPDAPRLARQAVRDLFDRYRSDAAATPPR
ncbi:TetR/AcrR family transcriptional regulator [Pseudoxanthomonas suwonensis]|uniref:TetR/AcrR family transcriptional regulator n=1 Tax=Pseudoxanthomonas suwonensis TaxID=314722 RepID=UPI00138F4D6C|nr:TetR/AcrR family transcriptional regulator [Pseudoxanthomonas suwonensis]KAF1699057.1 TetR family transcriptional regulator [Pseudoxanthomonas suwonensis]